MAHMHMESCTSKHAALHDGLCLATHLIKPTRQQVLEGLAGIGFLKIHISHYGHNKHMTGYIYGWKEQIHQ